MAICDGIDTMGVANDPGGVANDWVGVANDPVIVADAKVGVANDPVVVADDKVGVANKPVGVADAWVLAVIGGGAEGLLVGVVIALG